MNALKPLLAVLGIVGVGVTAGAVHATASDRDVPSEEAADAADEEGVRTVSGPASSHHAPRVARGLERDLEGTDLFIG